VRFPTAGGTSLAGVVMGNGRTAVALFHTTRADVCQLAWYAAELVAGGYQALLVDFTGDGASDSGTATPADDVVAAATFLRGRGVSRVALIGASKGANAVVGAAPLVQPPPLAVVSQSPPVRFQSVDGLAAAQRIAVPVLYVATTGDRQFPADTKQLHDATPPASGRQLLIVDGTAHGDVMLRTVPAVRQAVDAFLAAHVPV
jgi:dienelactone hydrolase